MTWHVTWELAPILERKGSMSPDHLDGFGCAAAVYYTLVSVVTGPGASWRSRRGGDPWPGPRTGSDCPGPGPAPAEADLRAKRTAADARRARPPLGPRAADDPRW